MIPVRIELRDFLSYRGTHVLDFAPIHVASIVGVNGAGKSAILDAITWSLFSQARKPTALKAATKADREHIINDFADSCEVTFEFDVEGTRYLVNRVMDRGGEIRVQFRQLTSDGEHDLRGKSTQKTDELIEKEIGFSYDIFISSSFVTQGDSSRFMDAKPSERREILSQILELDKYENCASKAGEKLKEVKDSFKEISTRRDLKLEVAQNLPTLEEELSKLQIELDDKEHSWSAKKDAFAKFQAEFSELETALRNMSQKSETLEKLSREKVILDNGIKELHDKIMLFEGIVSKEGEVTQGFDKLQVAKVNLEGVQAKADKFGELEKIRLMLESELAQEKARLESQKTQTQKELDESKSANAMLPELERERNTLFEQKNKISELSAQINALESDLKLAKGDFDQKEKTHVQASKNLELSLKKLGLATSDEAEDELGKMDDLRCQLASLEEDLKALIDEEKRLGELKAGLTADIAHINEELKLISGGQLGVCPLCGQELPQGGSETLKVKKQETLTQLESDLANIRTSITKTGAKRLDAEQETKRFKASLERIPALEQIASLAKNIAELLDVLNLSKGSLDNCKTKFEGFQKQNAEFLQKSAKIESDFITAETRLSQSKSKAQLQTNLQEQFEVITAKLVNGDFLHDKKSQLKETQEMIETLAFISANLVNAREEVKALSRFEREKSELDLAISRLASSLESLAKDSARLREVSTEEEKLKVELGQLPSMQAKKIQTEKDMKEAKASEVEAQRQRDECKSKLDVTLKKTQDAKAAQIEYEQLLTQTKAIEDEQKILEYCKAMFSLEGIPSHILQGVVPQLEEVSNFVLERISAGHPGSDSMRMEIKLERESKTSPKSTLDIFLTDGDKRRPYELFSGGERFRADFAIRIGLSKLLAQRSGAKLRTLVIDEGFGTQDSIGIQSLTEAINEIAGDFEKVLVVSHVEEMKNAFERKIVVSRDEAGSHFEVY
jgi:exonuclease SbcC